MLWHHFFMLCTCNVLFTICIPHVQRVLRRISLKMINYKLPMLYMCACYKPINGTKNEYIFRKTVYNPDTIRRTNCRPFHFVVDFPSRRHTLLPTIRKHAFVWLQLQKGFLWQRASKILNINGDVCWCRYENKLNNNKKKRIVVDMRRFRGLEWRK